MNKLSVLKQNKFATLSLEEKLTIKKAGRPTPNLNIVQVQGGRTVRSRKFNKTMYTKNSWLCGCEETNKLFCFVCLLLGGDSDTWATRGTNDVVHIWEKMKCHEQSKSHMNNVFTFSLIGTDGKIATQLNSRHRKELAKHNEQVDKNKHVLTQVINCIRFSGAFDLALKGQDDALRPSENRGMFKELINFSSELDKDLKDHINKCDVLKGLSTTIQNEVLECMMEVYHEEVRKGIEDSPFVAVVINEATDVSCELQLVIILRYLDGGKPAERFWNFYSLKGHGAESISQSVFEAIDPLLQETPNKLIGQSYDGTSMSGNLNVVRTNIRSKYPLANFIHCYTHEIDLIVASATLVNPQARIFFANLSSLCSFLSVSPKRIEILNEVIHKRLPNSSQTQCWNFQSRGIDTVYEHRKDLITVMKYIEVTSRDLASVNQASGYKLKLQDENFIFWLFIFQKIMPYVETIFDQLQKEYTYSAKISEDLENFEQAIHAVRLAMDGIIDEIERELNLTSELEEDGPPPKKARQSIECSKKKEALAICDAILMQIKQRFSFSGHLVATNLVTREKFTYYQTHFPEQYLIETCKKFPFLNKSRLKVELQVLYHREELNTTFGSDAVPLLVFLLNENDLKSTFDETIKLLSILVTVPMTTPETERCFSLQKRIRTFLTNTVKEERLSTLCMLSAEKHFVDSIDNFNNKVIQKFTDKQHRKVHFTYRKL